MKKLLLVVIALFAFTLVASAQLANWTIVGGTNFPTDLSPQINGYCRITQMKFHSTDPEKFYAVTAEGGLFTTSDAGQNWTVAAGTESLSASCASVCVDRTNDQIIYLGTGDPNYYSNGSGIYKSTDGGVTFTATTLVNCLAYDIVQSPVDAGTFVAITNKGIYKTVDNGTTWTASTATNIKFTDLQQNTAANSLILYACTNENVPRFYRSIDFGSNWTEITSGIVAPSIVIQSGGRIAVTPADPDVVYFSQVGGGGMLFKSTDGGLNFTLQKNEGAPYLTFYNDDPMDSGQGNYNNALCVDRNDPAKVWIQSHNTWYSEDSGVTWTMLCRWSTILHTDHHYLIQNPNDAAQLLSCNDGGVWVSTDGGASWTPISNGLYAYEVASNAGKSSHTNPSLVSIGTQDNGRLYSSASNWYTTVGGDDYAKREFDYLPNGGYWYNMDKNERTKAPNGPTATYGIPTATVQAMGFNKTNTELGFMGNQDIYRTANLSAAVPNWVQISTFNKNIKAVHSCIADPDRLYVITNDQFIYVSTDATSAAPTFNSYALPAASNSIASITAICTNADIVYISINSKVYRSADGGQTWTNITGTLPNVNHRRILSEDFGGGDELVFIATNSAVYYRKASSATWTNYSTNLPTRRSPTDFSMFDDGTNRARIRYTSYGRAVWETDFSNLRSDAVSFTADHTNDLCLTGGVVKFTDLSLGGPTAWSWSFPGGTPTTSTDQNPTVTYSTSGTYDVTLTITTAAGMSTSTQTSYITAPTLSGGGTYNVGVGGAYTTLTAAVADWNANCINGAVVYNLTDANYPSETFPITIDAKGPSSSLLIKPTGITTITGSSSSALIIVNGADRVTIDGSIGNTANTICPPSSATRDLTITNTNTGTSSAVVWIQSNGSNGATDNTVKNCNLVGNTNTTTLFGVGSGSSTISTSSFGVGNHHTTFLNNRVQKAQYGIYSGGESLINKNSGVKINQNILNSASPNNILRTGILVKYEDNLSISGNLIGNTNVQNNTGSLGIACGAEASGSYTNFSGSEVTGATITYNVIDNIVRAQSFGSATGIFIAAVNSTTGTGPNVVANNMISRISAPSAAADQYASGITIGGGRNSNTKLYYNSVNLSGTQSNNIQTFCMMIGGSENFAIVELKDNILVNQSSSTNRNYVLGTRWEGTYPRLNFDYNDLFASGAHFAVVGGLGNSPAGDRTTFAAWKTEAGTDAQSKNVLPEFSSNSNLHLNVNGANNLANLIGFGTPVSVTTDIDCENRYSNPDIGADENCISPTVPTLSASASPICVGGSTTLSISTGKLNKALDWYWYTGSCGGVLVGTGASITVSPTSTTTYYVRGEGGCVTEGSCGSITVTVNIPAPSISGPAAVCSGSDATLDAGPGYNSYTWSGSGGIGQTETYTNLSLATTFTVTVTDEVGCTGSAQKTVSINPLPNPSISGTLTICEGENTILTATGGATYSWNNGEMQAAITVNPSITSTYTVTASTALNCTATSTITVTVNPLPIMTCPASSSANISDPAFSLSGGMPLGGTYSGPGVNAGTFDPATAGAGPHTITYAYTDGNTCTNACTFTITVIGSGCPAFISAPANVTIVNSTCNMSCVASNGDIIAPAGSPCPMGSTLQYQVNNGSWSSILPTYAQSGPAQSIKTRCSCDADNMINSAESIAVTTIPADCTDNTLPTITCPANIAVSNAAGLCSATVSYSTPTGTDNCPSPTTTQTAGLASGASFPIGITTNTFKVTDGANNTNTCAFTVTVTDAQLPTISCPANIAVSNAAGLCSATVSYSTPVGTDNCPSPSTTQTAGLASGSSFPIGITTNTFKVTDGANNTNTCAFTVTVTDTELPAITCPANIAVSNAAGLCNATVSYSTPAGTDNCPSPTTTQTAGLASGASFPIGITTNTFKVTDGANNTNTCAFTVTVTDTQAPTITCPANIAANNTPGLCSAVVNYTAPVGTDNCSGATTARTAGLASGSVFPVGLTTNTFTVTAGNGQTTACSFNVTVSDNELPTISCPANIAKNTDLNQCSAVTSYLAPVGADNCSGATTARTAGLASGAAFPRGVTTNTFTVTAGNGQTASCSFTVTVTDNQAPSITCPANQNISAGANCSGTVGAWNPSAVSDNCTASGLITVTQTPVPSTALSGHNASALVTLNAEDGNGNSASCSFTVTLKDVTPPVAKCKNITANLDPNGTVTVAPSAVNNASTDNCNFTLSLTPNTFACFSLGVNNVTLRATDAGGNTSTCIAKITVKDNTGPNARCKNPTVFLDASGNTSLSVAQVNNGSNDPCGIASISLSKSTYNCGEITGQNPVTLDLKDVNGNASSCLAYVTVLDALPPTPVCEDVTVQLAANGKVSVYPSTLAANSFDNCSVYTYSPTAKLYTTANVGDNNLTITVKDFSGNQSTCVSVVTVEPFNFQQDKSNRNDSPGASEVRFKVYPNPNSGEFFVSFDLSAEQAIWIRLYDMQGRLVLDQTANAVEGENTVPLRLQDFAPGVYLLDFQADGLKEQTKVVVQHP